VFLRVLGCVEISAWDSLYLDYRAELTPQRRRWAQSATPVPPRKGDKESPVRANARTVSVLKVIF